MEIFIFVILFWVVFFIRLPRHKAEYDKHKALKKKYKKRGKYDLW